MSLRFVFAGCLPHRILSHASERTSLSRFLSHGCLSRIEQKRTLETVSVGWLIGSHCPVCAGSLVNRFCRFLSLDYQLVCVLCWLFQQFFVLLLLVSVIFVFRYLISTSLCVCDFCYCYTFSRVCIYNCIVTYLIFFLVLVLACCRIHITGYE